MTGFFCPACNKTQTVPHDCPHTVRESVTPAAVPAFRICACGHHEDVHRYSLRGAAKETCFDCNYCACESFRPKTEAAAAPPPLDPDSADWWRAIAQRLGIEVFDLKTEVERLRSLQASLVEEMLDVAKASERFVSDPDDTFARAHSGLIRIATDWAKRLAALLPARPAKET